MGVYNPSKKLQDNHFSVVKEDGTVVGRAGMGIFMPFWRDTEVCGFEFGTVMMTVILFGDADVRSGEKLAFVPIEVGVNNSYHIVTLAGANAPTMCYNVGEMYPQAIGYSR